jgi:hypothetical protein
VVGTGQVVVMVKADDPCESLESSEDGPLHNVMYCPEWTERLYCLRQER